MIRKETAVTSTEFRAARVEAGLSFRKAATALGVNKSTIQRWESGESPIPAFAEVVIRDIGAAWPSAGHALGRLTAAIETAFAITPTEVAQIATRPPLIATLIARLHQPESSDHLARLEPEVTELLARVPPTLPEHLPASQQAAFWVGYYQRRGGQRPAQDETAE